MVFGFVWGGWFCLHLVIVNIFIFALYKEMVEMEGEKINVMHDRVNM